MRLPSAVNDVPAGVSYHDEAVSVYVVERRFAEELELGGEDLTRIDEINADEGIRWLFSFLSADRRQMYCLYQAPSSGRDYCRRPQSEYPCRRDYRARTRCLRPSRSLARLGCIAALTVYDWQSQPPSPHP